MRCVLVVVCGLFVVCCVLGESGLFVVHGLCVVCCVLCVVCARCCCMLVVVS